MTQHSSSVLAALREADQVRILVRIGDVVPFVPQVQSHADADKNALGFFPANVYRDAAESGKLLIAAVCEGDSQYYAGHLYFGGSFPNARIFQLYVVRKFRHKGIGRKLIQQLVQSLEANHYIGISAVVADDLIDSNAVWERLGFKITRQKRGGASRGRLLNVRVRPLDTRTLFGDPDRLPTAPASVAAQISVPPPVYVIDLNVFFDVIHGRLRAAEAGEVISAGLNNLVRILVTSEFATELRRHSRIGDDPVLEFAVQLPTIQPPPQDELRSLIATLGPLVFDAKLRNSSLKARDYSDLTHLATAIHHNATGFITSEEAIVKAGRKLFDSYGIRILHVSEFARVARLSSETTRPIETRFASWTMQVRECGPDLREGIENFLSYKQLPSDFLEDFRVASSGALAEKKALAVLVGGSVVAGLVTEARSGFRDVCEGKILADEEHAAIETSIGVLIGKASSEVCKAGPVVLRLAVPSRNVVTQALLMASGFTRTALDRSDDQILQKICLGDVVVTENWPSLRAWLKHTAGVHFAETLPRYALEDSDISFHPEHGPEQKLKLSKLETLLSPGLVLVPNRPAALVPIQRQFADELLDSSEQLGLLPVQGASLLREKVYFSNSRNARVLRRGLPLIFYESSTNGGRSAAIAIGRILETVVASKTEIPTVILNHGVLGADSVEKLTSSSKVAITTFDNLFRLKNPISVRRLRELRCGGGANFISATSITPDQLQTIVKEGKPGV